MDDSGSYRRLDHVKVQDTVEDVGSRIRRRFPASGLGAVANELAELVPHVQRAQRQRMLRLLHQLRSLAHVVDMHQLTKDPEQREAAFVVPQVGAELLRQYLSYCSELLSLVGKAAALCAEESQDPLVLASVGDLETMTAELSQTIWQKISALPQDVSSAPPIPPE